MESRELLQSPRGEVVAGSTSSRTSASPDSDTRRRRKPVPYITTNIEKVDEYCVVIRGMFGGLGTAEDRRLAKERSLVRDPKGKRPPPGPIGPPKCQQRAIEMSGEGLGKTPSPIARFFYWMGKFCWVGCCPPFPSPIIHKIVFQPPDEASYSFFAPDGTRLKRSNLRKYDDPEIEFRVTFTKEVKETVITSIDLTQLTGFIVRKGNGSHVAGVYLPADDPSSFLFIYAHANAMDVGFTIPFIYKLRRKLGCSVVTYDYSGYGLSSGSCTESEFFGDAEAVFKHVTETLALAATNRVILYGFSLGTAATAHLATKISDLAAVVLSGAFISAVNCIRRIPSDKDYPCESIDKFRTYKSVPLISAPTLVCHGLEDQITGMEQGLWILERCQRPLEPLFLPDTAHNDMDKPPVWSRLRQMIHHDLGDPQPHVALRSRFEDLLRQTFPQLHLRCLEGPAVCLACRTRVASFFFERKRLKIIGLDLEFVESARRIRWEVEPRGLDDGGSWEGRFNIILFSALVSGPEIRLLADHNDRALPDPPAPTPSR